MSGTKSGQEGKWNFNVFCLLTGELMLVKHIRSTVFGSASHFCWFFRCTCRRGGTGSWRKCSLHHDWACNTLASTFHGQACAFEQRTVETRRGNWVLIHFTDLVLKQYFTNDLLNLNVHHHKRHWRKWENWIYLNHSLFGTAGAGWGESINLNASIINQIQ